MAPSNKYRTQITKNVVFNRVNTVGVLHFVIMWEILSLSKGKEGNCTCRQTFFGLRRIMQYMDFNTHCQ